MIYESTFFLNTVKEERDVESVPYSELWTGDDTDAQAKVWAGDVGREWVERNPSDVEATNTSWRQRFGVDKISCIREVLHGVPRSDIWLEVGCASGAHMRCMQACGWKNIFGFDINLAGVRDADRACVADARHLPFADGTFDGVTTSGTLMHLGPDERMTDCLLEMCRVARKWLFFIEIFHPDGTLISFGDLLPPAWVMPWREYLGARLPPDWAGVRGRVVHGYTGANPAPLAIMLIQKV